MKVVYKYELAIVGTVERMLPAGAQVLSVQQQGASVQLWALVDQEAPPELRRFHILGTGHPAGNRQLGRHVSTFQYDDLVFHVFEDYPT